MPSKKMLDEIALFVQELLKDRPMKYSEVRERVCKKYNLTKTKAGNILHMLNRRRNFLSLTFAYEKLYNGVVYLPEHSSEAWTLYKEIKESIPLYVRWTNRRLHRHLLSRTRRIKLQNPELPADLLVEVLRWKLKISKNLAQNLIGELES